MYFYWTVLLVFLILIYYLQYSAQHEVKPLEPIETSRLSLRLWVLSDAEDLYEYAKNPIVGPRAGWPPHSALEISKSIIQNFIEEKNVYAIELKESGKVIGSVSLHNRCPEESLKHLKQREIGYVLNPDYWGQGYMPEAVAAVIDYCMTTMNLDILWCGHFVGNNNSRRVIEKSGFVYKFTKETNLPLMNNKKEQTLFYAIEKKH